MSDTDKVNAFLKAHLPDHLIISLLEKPADQWNGRCILDMFKEDRANEVLEAFEKIF